MNILVIGNGFDLAHKLPTRYDDFLDTMQFIRDKINQIPEFTRSNNDDDRAKSEILKIYNTDKDLYKKIGELVQSNIWIDYFLAKRNNMGKGWIDFETEISRVIQALDYMRKVWPKWRQDNNYKYDRDIQDIEEEIKKFIAPKVSIAHLDKNEYKKKLIVPLIDDLNKLIECLEVYLAYIVNHIKVTVNSSDIMGLTIDKILSFNYTNTYFKIYDINYNEEHEKDKYDFIHGKIKEKNINKENDLVLGIDEYLDEEIKNKDTDFIQFKKYFQRIHKETGCKYKMWVNKIEKKEEITTVHNEGAIPWIELEPVLHNVYIFGHSLDITDKDILKRLIQHDNVVTTIFYLNKEVYAQQIANLVKVIGQDEVIERVSNPNRTIIFKKQRDMVPIV